MTETGVDPSTPKQCQAVIVIHGIGEQRPMDTLRSFVETMLDIESGTESDPGVPPAYYSQPDSFSDSFELRSLRTRASRPRTEFFELYWAHRMPFATWARLLEWLRLLLRRSRADIPAQFRGLWWVLWITVILVGVLLAASILFSRIPAIRPMGWFEGPIVLPIGVAVLLLFVQAIVLSYVGDAAIYLSPNPRNIEARHAIRSAGVALIERLHQSGNYDRIIVVGHSLGSVIGYDVLTYTWQRFHERHGSPQAPQRDSLKTAEKIAKQMRAPTPTEPEPPSIKWAEATRALWCERRESGSPWLVTDFITLGSPLAHGDLLLARSRDDFARKVCQRELPVCPPIPDLEGGFSYPSHYTVKDGSPRTVFVLHHAAWLAVVRWTNLYFPCRFLFHGDVVGGPVAPLFGPGVRDVPVQTRFRGGWLAHTHYWKRDARDASSPNAPIKQLRDAIDLWRRSFPKSCNYI